MAFNITRRRRKFNIDFVEDLAQATDNIFEEYLEASIKEAEDIVEDIFNRWLDEFARSSEEINRADYSVSLRRIRGPRTESINLSNGEFSVPRIVVTINGETFNGSKYINVVDLLDQGDSEGAYAKRYPGATPLFNLRDSAMTNTNGDVFDFSQTPIRGRVPVRPNLDSKQGFFPVDIVFIRSPAVGDLRHIPGFDPRNIFDRLTEEVNKDLESKGNPIRFDLKDR